MYTLRKTAATSCYMLLLVLLVLLVLLGLAGCQFLTDHSCVKQSNQFCFCLFTGFVIFDTV